MGTCQITKNGINRPNQDNSFCVKNYDLWRLPSPMNGCMGWWVNGWDGIWDMSIE